MPENFTIGGEATTLYDKAEVAEILGVTTRTVQQYINDERIPAALIGKKWRISEPNLRAFINGAKFTQRGYNIGRGRNKSPSVEPPKWTGAQAYEQRVLYGEDANRMKETNPNDYAL